METDALLGEESGLKEFFRNSSMSGDVTEEEIEFLKRLKFRGKRPTPLYYYRASQALRDPLHFRGSSVQTPRAKTTGPSQPKGSIAPMHKHLGAHRIEQQMQLDGRRRATQRWVENKRSKGKNGKAGW
jgi:hypothetical protein